MPLSHGMSHDDLALKVYARNQFNLHDLRHRDKNNPKFDVVRKLVNQPSVDMELTRSGNGLPVGSAKL